MRMSAYVCYHFFLLAFFISSSCFVFFIQRSSEQWLYQWLQTVLIWLHSGLSVCVWTFLCMDLLLLLLASVVLLNLLFWLFCCSLTVSILLLRRRRRVFFRANLSSVQLFYSYTAIVQLYTQTNTVSPFFFLFLFSSCISLLQLHTFEWATPPVWRHVTKHWTCTIVPQQLYIHTHTHTPIYICVCVCVNIHKHTVLLNSFALLCFVLFFSFRAFFLSVCSVTITVVLPQLWLLI